MSVFVVDTGEQDLYVIADENFEAGEAVAALGERIVDVEHYSDDDDDVPNGYPVIHAVTDRMRRAINRGHRLQ